MSEKEPTTNALIVVVRLRSGIGLRQDVKDTLTMLNLTRTHHAIIIDKRPSYSGMLQVAKDAITWGEVDVPTLSRLLSKRGRLPGSKHLTDEYIANNTAYKSIDDYAAALVALKEDISTLPKLKKVFRLHPPSKGFRGSIKRSYQQKGELGYRGSEINGLVQRMS